MPEQHPPPPDYPPPPEYPAAPYPPPPAFPYPPPYGAPYGGSMPMPVPMPVQGTNGFAIASLTLGIACLCTGLCAIPAVICGHIALAQINRPGGMEQGRGMAIAGLVLGYIFLAFIVLYIAFIVAISAIPSFQSY